MALSSKNAKPLVQLKVEAYEEAAKLLKQIDAYDHFEVNNVSAWHFAKRLEKESRRLKFEYRDTFVD